MGLFVRNHLCEVYKLAKLINIQFVKTYLLSTMTQGKRNHLMILSAYRDRIEEMDLRKVTSIFVQKNDGRRHTFGKFEFS